MDEKARDAAELISEVGRRWVQRHRLSIASFEAKSVVSLIGNRYITRKRIDPVTFRPPYGFDAYDILILKKGRWLLSHRYKHFLYEDQGSGHGKLTVFGHVLPELACSVLYGSGRPVEEVVELPQRFMLHKRGGAVISAKSDGKDSILRMRIGWLEIAKLTRS